MKNLYLIFTLLLCTVFIGCDPDESNPGPNPSSDSFSDNFGSEVSRDFIGQVVDMDNNPVQGATINIGTSTKTTDVNGVFLINDAQVYERFAYITATKAGYIMGSRSMVPTSGKNHVRIMLIPSTPLQTIASGAASEVALPSGTKVTFDGAFEDANGVAYSGNVSVSMYHLEASNPNLGSLMPGTLYAETETGDEAALQTFGMLNVELRGSAGQKLQIAEGHVADIEMLIDPSQTATAPQTIPLWHFDEAKGYWKQEGSAVKSGNKYVGEVSHFSWWNCDMYTNTVALTITVVGQGGAPVSNIGVGLTIGTLISNISYTNELGQNAGMIPANEVLTLTLYSSCGDAIYSSAIGPFDVDTVLPTITVSLAADDFTTVHGSFSQCDSEPVSEGYVMLWYENGNQIIPVNSGSYSASILICGTTADVTIFGFDSQNSLATDVGVYEVEFPQTEVNLNACIETGVFNLSGSFTVVVTRLDNGESVTFPNEVITLVGPVSYNTTTVGFFGPPEITGGINFITSSNIIQVPDQTLPGFSNLVYGTPGNSIDGSITDNDHFTINYTIAFAAGNRDYSAVYTRN